MPSMRDIALNIIAGNPGVSGNPNAQHMIDVIRRGDSVQGEQIARNLCQTYGITPEQAVEQARRMFRF